MKDEFSPSSGEQGSEPRVGSLSGRDARARGTSDELKELQNFSQRLAVGAGVEDLLRSLVDGIVSAVAPDLVLVFRRRDDQLELVAEGPESAAAHHDSTPVHRVGECLCGLACRAGAPQYSDDIQVDPRCTWTECKKAGFRSFAALPMVHGGEVLGVLGLASLKVRDFSEHAAFLESLSSQAAIAVRSSVLLDEVRQRTRELVRELTERTEAERVAAESRAFAQAVLDALPTHVCVVDAGGIIVATNAAWQEFADLNDGAQSPTVRPGANYIEVCRAAARTGDPDAAEALAGIKGVLSRSLELFELEYPCHALHEERWFMMRVTPLADGLRGAVICHINITNLRGTQEKLRQNQEHLRQAQKLEGLGRLAGGMAHDFNNLLQAVSASTAVLVLEVDNPAGVLEAAGELQRCVDRGAALTRQLLLFSRQEAPQVKACDLNLLVDENTSMLQRLLREDITLEHSLWPDPVPVLADEAQLTQVVVNLAINSSDAMPGGGKLVLRTGIENADEVFFEVEDSGCGIPPEIRERIFDPFFSTKVAGRGTGLGLAVVEGIVSSHQGRIGVHSDIGVGSRFHVVLPRFTGTDHLETTPAPRPANVVRGEGESILVVEDNDIARAALSRTLEAVGYRTAMAESAETAWEMLQEHPYDLILTDMILPGDSGATLAERARARWPGVRVVLMSGYMEDESVHLSAETRTIHFLQKPFEVHALTRILRSALAEPPEPPLPPA